LGQGKTAGQIIHLKEYLPYNLVVAADRVANVVAGKYAAQFELTLQQWRVLSVLAADGPLSHQEIGTLSTLQPVAISRAATDLLDRGLIFRHEGGDRRQRRVELTAKGRSLYDRIVPVALGIEASLELDLSEAERDALHRMLLKVRDAAERLLGDSDLT
jgi:DNA-binding MarR family transcriptional regulator